jgi:hypothetical protein
MIMIKEEIKRMKERGRKGIKKRETQIKYENRRKEKKNE